MAEPRKHPRRVTFIPSDSFIDGHGWRVSIVVEGEDCHHPTGDWPYHGRPGEVLPWFWGPSLADAQRAARDYNRALGVSDEEADVIVARSMTSGRSRGRR